MAGLPARVEAARRGDLVTLINHGDEQAEIAIEGTDAETGAALSRVVLDSQEVAFVYAPAGSREATGRDGSTDEAADAALTSAR